MNILMLNETEVQRLLDPDSLLDALAEGFRALSSGLIDAPKRIGVSVPNTGFLLAMPAYQQSQAITVKLVSVFHGNRQLYLRLHGGNTFSNQIGLCHQAGAEAGLLNAFRGTTDIEVYLVVAEVGCDPRADLRLIVRRALNQRSLFRQRNLRAAIDLAVVEDVDGIAIALALADDQDGGGVHALLDQGVGHRLGTFDGKGEIIIRIALFIRLAAHADLPDVEILGELGSTLSCPLA